MIFDRETERRVEDWLEATASPMPQEALESALEAVARTAQVGKGSRWPAWTRRRAFSRVATAVVVLLVVTAGWLTLGALAPFIDGTGSSPSGSPQTHRWDPVADFRRAPYQLNPSPDSYGNEGVWSYRRSSKSAHDPMDYYLLSGFEGDAWVDRDYVNLFIGLGAADRALYFHPWSDGAVRKHAILGWTSPITGDILISGAIARVQDDCDVPSANVIFTIDRGVETLHTIAVDVGQSGTFDATATVALGETIYFVFDADSDARCDLTTMRLEITSE